MHVPDYVILELESLPQMTEVIRRSYEHLPDVSPNMPEEEIEDSLCRIMDCVSVKEMAQANLDDMFESQCQHDLEFDQGEFKFANQLNAVGNNLFQQLNAFGMYYDGSFLPYFYKERIGSNAIVLQRINYQGAGDD